MFNKITLALLLAAIWLNSDSAAEPGSKPFADRVLATMTGNLDSGR